MGKRVTPMIPGIFTKAEQDAAFALQRAGVAHPAIDDATFAHIDERLAALPRIWGRGPWIDRSDHIVGIRTSSGISGRLYRVTTEVWGLELWGTSSDEGVHRGDLDELLARTVAAWPPAPAGAAEPSDAERRSLEAYQALVARTAHTEPLPGAQWLEAPTEGPVVLPALGDFSGPPCSVTWETTPGAPEQTPAQAAAARALVTQGPAIRDALLDALLRDQREFREDADFPLARAAAEILDQLELQAIYITRAAKDGLAYTAFTFSDGWRVEHGLSAVMHGARLVAVGGHEDTREIDDDAELEQAPSRTPNGALVAGRWLDLLQDAVVALPLWDGLRGRFHVSFVYEDDAEPEVTAEQKRAAELFVEQAAAIRAAVLGRLLESYRRSPAATREIASVAGIGELVEARKIRVHAAAWRGVAYTELVVRAPWRRFQTARVLMLGPTVVALTTKQGVEAAIEEDLEERLAAARARRKRRR